MGCGIWGGRLTSHCGRFLNPTLGENWKENTDSRSQILGFWIFFPYPKNHGISKLESFGDPRTLLYRVNPSPWEGSRILRSRKPFMPGNSIPILKERERESGYFEQGWSPSGVAQNKAQIGLICVFLLILQEFPK